MTREAAALRTPAYTLATGSLATVDAALLAEGRLVWAGGADDIVLRKKETRTAAFAPRDPRLFADRLVELARRRSRRARLGHFVQDVGDEHTPPFV